MKLNKLALAVITLLPITAFAGVTISPLAGYHSYGDSDAKQRNATVATRTNVPPNLGAALYSKETRVGGAIGIEITPSLTFEADYVETQTKAALRDVHVPRHRFDARHQIMSGNFLVGLGFMDTQRFKPYGLIGAGRSFIYLKNLTNRSDTAETKDTIANVGFGAMYRLTDHIALRGEGRAVYNADHNWWESLALGGIQITLGNHLEPALIAAATMPAVVDSPKLPEEIVVSEKKALDSDRDGVENSTDQCPNTVEGMMVDASGCPQQTGDTPVKVELRVFFDTNKSNIKPQFKPEIKKAADLLKEVPATTAKIEGHTDSRGPRSLNDRLSLARANSVKSVLVKDYGIDSQRIATEGFADTRPVASNATAEGRAMNRRVYAVVSK